ncbi:glycosyltransferase family 9 protein [Cetobacterium sp. SF1]|uniref:glycosyltransferase family 9 protein n=1 Tax=Cetobacterium sp. SF1 TaxID=3417654 RepID=UPI003CE790CA
MKIIISRTDKIGDLILSIPSFYMVRKMFPDAEITVLVRKYNYEIVKNLPYIDRVLKIDDYRQKELLEKIVYFKSDIFIALYVDKFVAQLAKASKAKKRIGPLSKLYSFFAFNKGIFQRRSKSIKHEAEYNLDLIKKIDSKLYEENFEINTEIILEEKHRLAARTFYRENSIKKNTLIVNPFMGGSAKNITDKQYASLIQKFKDEHKDFDVIITAHITQEHRGNQLLKDIDREGVFLYANGGELLNIGAIIERGTLYFGGSTGPTHIAGSLQKPIVAIYPKKPTQSPKRWGVFGNDNVTYIIPDKDNKKEKYSHEYFDSYTENTEREILDALSEKIRKED